MIIVDRFIAHVCGHDGTCAVTTSKTLNTTSNGNEKEAIYSLKMYPKSTVACVEIDQLDLANINTKLVVSIHAQCIDTIGITTASV